MNHRIRSQHGFVWGVLCQQENDKVLVSMVAPYPRFFIDRTGELSPGLGGQNTSTAIHYWPSIPALDKALQWWVSGQYWTKKTLLLVLHLQEHGGRI